MRIYSEIVFNNVSPKLKDILVAELAEAGFDGFLEEEGKLKAYIDQAQLERGRVEGLCETYQCSFQVNQIREENWNASWESSFSPVLVDNFVAVRADFHNVVDNVEYEIIITPKMSFGTGHHATTWLMMKAMQEFSLKRSEIKTDAFSGKSVLDFGTGTGLLAILANKMGANQVLAIDNDTWSIENAAENIARNGCQNIELRLGEEIPVELKFDLVLANINKHILLGHCQAISDAVRPGGHLFISGILSEDQQDMAQAFSEFLKGPISVVERNNWLVMTFSK